MAYDWKDDYFRLLNLNKADDAFNLKLKHLPNRLYKYRPLNENTLTCLLHNSVWMTQALELNDPYECSMKFDFKRFSLRFFKRENFKQEFFEQYNCHISNEEIESITKHDNPELGFREVCKLKNIYRDYNGNVIKVLGLFESFMNKQKTEIHISSFTERNNSILMWSHYARYHTGICVEYNFITENKILPYIEPVLYTDNLMDFSEEKGAYFYRITSCTKALDWNYEKEWRIVFPIINNPLPHNHCEVPIPIAIYLGSRFEQNHPENKAKLKLIAKRLNVPLFQMGLHPSEFNIVVQPN